MGEITTTNTSVNLNTKKGRQIALENKILEIDTRLKELGVGTEIKYKVGAITNPETLQNTINISNVSDISFLLRILALYTNQLTFQREFNKKHKIVTPRLTNTNGYLVVDVMHDIELRILLTTNIVEINKLKSIKEKLLPFMNEDSRFINTLKEVTELMKS